VVFGMLSRRGDQCLLGDLVTEVKLPRAPLVLGWLIAREDWALWPCVRSLVWILICDRPWWHGRKSINQSKSINFVMLQALLFGIFSLLNWDQSTLTLSSNLLSKLTYTLVQAFHQQYDTCPSRATSPRWQPHTAHVHCISRCCIYQ